MKIMSIDYGDAREILASAYAVIKESYQPKLAARLIEIINKEKAEMVVIGLPRNMDGSYGFRADKCRELGKLLKSEIDIPVDFEDERLTTVIAHDILSSNNVCGKKRKNTVDAVSAVVILQSYIDKRNKK